MLKKILKLEGAQELSREQKQSIKGGVGCGVDLPPCKAGYHCVISNPQDVGYCKSN